MPKHFNQNQNSLSNLKPGNKLGSKVRVTKKLIQKLTDYLESDFQNFLTELESLPVKEKVNAKIKLITLLQPTAAFNLIEETEPVQRPIWRIIEVSPTSDLG